MSSAFSSLVVNFCKRSVRFLNRAGFYNGRDVFPICNNRHALGGMPVAEEYRICAVRVVLIILMRRFAPYRKWIFVSRRKSIAGYVTEPTYKKTLSRGCKATIRISEYINQNF